MGWVEVKRASTTTRAETRGEAIGSCAYSLRSRTLLSPNIAPVA